MRFFGSADRYFGVDYRSQIQTDYGKIPGEDRWGPIYKPNPYIVRIKGGTKVDKLTVDELDAPGVPLCGATIVLGLSFDSPRIICGGVEELCEDSAELVCKALDSFFDALLGVLGRVSLATDVL